MRVTMLIAAILGVAPAVVWAGATGRHVLSWPGLAMLAGYAGAGLFAVSMLLMLRVRWLDRAGGGLGQVLQAHHSFGAAALLLVLLHPLALALGAWPAGALELLWPDPSSVRSFSGWIALLLFLAFFVVMLTTHLRFDRWRRWHRASVLAYGAMIWHLLAAWSGSLAASLGLGLVAAGALGFVHRLLVEDAPRGGLRYRVLAVHPRGPDVVDLVLDPLAEPLRFEAGQFVYLALVDSPAYRGCGELHPYTLTGRPEDPRLHLSIKALGDCTRHIQDLTPGAEALVKGPFGGLFPPHPRYRDQVWIGGGIGVTPFLSRAATIAGAPRGAPRIDIVYAATSEGAALHLDDLRAVVGPRAEMRLHTIFEDTDGLPTVELIEARVGSLAGREFMVAGPPAMVRALQRALRARGVAASSIHTEEGVLR